MQGTIQKYVLDMADGKKNAPLRVKQYDTNSRWASISLTAFGEPWPVPAGCRACIAVKKTDGTSVLNDCTIEGSNTVLAPITDQTTAVQGIQQAELYFLAVDGDIKSQTFPINVYPAIMDQRVIESSDEFGTLQTAIIGAQEATRTAQDAASEAMVQAGEARDAAEIAMDAAASIDEAVQAATRAKTSETNAKASETAAAQYKTDVEAMKAAFAGYDKTESGRKYANALTTMKEGDGQVVVTDAWDAPVVNLEVDGASEQVATTGAQLLDLKAKKGSQVQNGITLTINADGSVAVNGTATSDTTFILSSNGHIPLEVGKNYAMRGYGTSFDNNFFWQAWVKDPGGSYKDTGAGATFLYTKESEFNFSVLVKSGKTVNATFWPMLNKGSAALPWEPYTGGKPSPSPEYPQEIVSVAHVANSGAQLLDLTKAKGGTIAGITIVVNKNGSYTCSGTATEDDINVWLLGTYSEQAPPLFILKSGTYYKSGMRIFNGTNNVGPAYDGVFTLTEDTPISGVRALKLESGKTYSNYAVYPMLAASATPIPWEPYNGQQREIDLTVDSSGKNLFNKEAAYSYNVSGVQIAQLEKGIRISNATARVFAAAAVKLKLKPYTTYTYSCDITALTVKSTVGIRKSTDGGISYIATLISSFSAEDPAKGLKRTFTTDSYTDYALCLFCTNDVEMSGATTFENIQLEEGATATAWEPYAGYQSAIIPLVEPLYGIGDVKDKFGMRDGVWGIERRFDVQIFDGSSDEAWVAVLNNDGVNYRNGTSFIKPKSKANGAVLCTAFTKKDGVTNSLPGFKIAGDASIITYSEAYNTSDVSLWTAYLAENPMTIVYELAMPTWEPFPEDIQADLNALATHPGTTYLTVTSTDVAAPMRLTYVQDTRKVIDSLKLDMAEQMIELQAQIDQLKVTNNLS